MLTSDQIARADQLHARHAAYLQALAAPPAAAVPPGPSLSEWAYVTTARLAEDTRALAYTLPPDVDLVVGVARSGLLPAGLIAYQLHTPLFAVSRHAGVTDPGHGFRLEGRDQSPPRHVLLVDDTVATGREMTRTVPTVRAAFPGARVTTAAVYVHPERAGLVDHFGYLYPGPHFLEWNWPNAGHGASCAYDFDGILCHDGPGKGHLPLFLPRRKPVPLVVTGRHESARAVTQEWLDRHGVRVDRLVMRDFGRPDEFDPVAIASYKARHYRESACTLFAESDPGQAEQIARETGRPVLCPAAGKVFTGPGPDPGLARIPPRLAARAVELVRACEWFTRDCSCAFGGCTHPDSRGATDLRKCHACLSRRGLL